MLSSFVSEFQKCHLFCRTTIRNCKNKVSKKWCHYHYSVFRTLHSKKKLLVWNFSTHAVNTQLCNIYSVFWISIKLSIFGHLFLKTRNFDFSGQKPKILKMRQQFCRAYNLTSFDVYGSRFTLISYIPESFECWPIFHTNRVTWRH